MSRLLMLVANDPPLARETIAVALQDQRPELDTMVVNPTELAERIERVHPDMVICSELTQTVETQVPSWVVLASAGNNAVTTVGGRRQEQADLSLADLVGLVDQTARLGPPLPVADAHIRSPFSPGPVQVRYWPQVMTGSESGTIRSDYAFP